MSANQRVVESFIHLVGQQRPLLLLHHHGAELQGAVRVLNLEVGLLEGPDPPADPLLREHHPAVGQVGEIPVVLQPEVLDMLPDLGRELRQLLLGQLRPVCLGIEEDLLGGLGLGLRGGANYSVATAAHC